MSLNSKLVKELQILALMAIESPTWDDWYRRICRWYSKEFSTPLSEVQDLTEETVIREYFEDQFYNMKMRTDDEGIEAYKNLKDNIINEEEIQAAEEQVEAEDDNWMQKELEKAAKEHEAALGTKDRGSEPNLENKAEPEERFVQGEDSSDFSSDYEPLEDD